MMRSLIWFVLSVFVLLGCESTPPTTEILVVVDSNLELDALHVEVLDRPGEALLKSQELEIASMPLSFSLYPVGNASALRLHVVGRDAGGRDVASKTVLARFAKEQRRLLTVYLDSSCIARQCPGDQTCESGECTAITEATLKPAGSGPLGGYEPEDDVIDAGRADAARPDAEAGRPDTGPPAECDDTLDCTPKLGTVTPAGCAIARCVDGTCRFEAADADGDGDRVKECRATGADITTGNDCNDNDRTVSSMEWDGPAAGTRPDRCDEVDNDCNGKPDDAMLDGASCTCDPAKDKNVACSFREDGSEVTWPAGTPVGACKAGTRSCEAGAWTPCVGLIEPKQSDSCITSDDDSNCNGVNGEGCACINGTTRPCGINIGECRQGAQACVDGQWATACVGGVTPKEADTCDPGNDANCNGTPNDNCNCINGNTSTCGMVLPNLGDCYDRPVTCTNGNWPRSQCQAQCNDCPSNNPCAPGTCEDKTADFECDCPPGYSGDGTKSCMQVNDCPANDPCAPGTCMDGVNTFTCDCPAGYDGDGTQGCMPAVTICPGGGIGMDAGPGVMCGANTECENQADGGINCACASGFVAVPGSDPPACAMP